MSSITPTDRSLLWSINIHTNVSTKLGLSQTDIRAGFICRDGLSISTTTTFEDLKILYPILHDCPYKSNLTLWQERNDGSAEFTSAADGDKEFNMTEESPVLFLGLILHNTNHPSCKTLSDGSASVAKHIYAGCAVVPTLNFDPDENGHLPDTLNYYIQGARSSSPSPPSKKRKLTEYSTSRPSTPDSLEMRQKQDQESREFAESLGIDTRSFEEEVKKSYSRCVITRTSSKWGTLTCGPGYVAAHIVPQKFWFSYPDWRPSSDFENYPFNVIPSYNTDEDNLQKRMQSTWNTTNGLLLRADIHDMFDRRTIAIHPATYKIRLFAPMPVAIEYHGQVVEWETTPDRVALAHHYAQCVIENVASHLTSASRCVVLENWKRAVSLISQSGTK